MISYVRDQIWQNACELTFPDGKVDAIAVVKHLVWGKVERHRNN
jgi:hypothetical protein